MPNLRPDVMFIQELLNRFQRPPLALLKVDGVFGRQTALSIERFQQRDVKLNDPDGVVHPDGPTFRALMHMPFAVLPPPSIGVQTNSIAWGAKVSPAFKAKVLLVARNLGVSADYLMAAMAFESGESFRADKKNGAGSGAVGLIQFMPKTAVALKTTVDALASMTPEDQLDYVEKYFSSHKGKLKTLDDLYMAILYPAGIGKGEDHILFNRGDKDNPTKVYSQNKGLDTNKDGKITVGEAVSKVKAKLEKGLKPGFFG